MWICSLPSLRGSGSLPLWIQHLLGPHFSLHLIVWMRKRCRRRHIHSFPPKPGDDISLLLFLFSCMVLHNCRGIWKIESSEVLRRREQTHLVMRTSNLCQSQLIISFSQHTEQIHPSSRIEH